MSRTASSSTETLVLRSALYIDYLLAAVPLIQAHGINGSAVDGDRPLPMIATRDVKGCHDAAPAEG
jgi:hypothetical protein